MNICHLTIRHLKKLRRDIFTTGFLRRYVTFLDCACPYHWWCHLLLCLVKVLDVKNYSFALSQKSEELEKHFQIQYRFLVLFNKILPLSIFPHYLFSRIEFIWQKIYLFVKWILLQLVQESGEYSFLQIFWI